jgi:hypothetical protein
LFYATDYIGFRHEAATGANHETLSFEQSS